MKKSLLLALFLVTVITISGCTVGSYTVKKSKEHNSSTKMSMSYENFNGYKKRQIKVKNGKPITMSIDIVTENGSLDVYIAKDNKKEESAFKKSNILTSSHTVTLSEEGTYTIRVDAKDHKGSYSFSWEE